MALKRKKTQGEGETNIKLERRIIVQNKVMKFPILLDEKYFSVLVINC